MKVYFQTATVRIQVSIDVPAKATLSDPLAQRDTILFNATGSEAYYASSRLEVRDILEEIIAKFLALDIKD